MCSKVSVFFVLVVCGANASVVFAEAKRGIAAKYDQDHNIDSDPAVIFHEDFEDENLRNRGWYDLKSWGTNLVITAKHQATGKKSLKLIYPKGSKGPWLRAPHFKHGYETLYVRYYRKWAKDWDWGGPRDANGHGTRLVANGPDLAAHAYKADDMIVLMQENAKRLSDWKRGFFGLMLFTKGKYFTDEIKAARESHAHAGHKRFGSEWWLDPIGEQSAPAAQPGKWHYVEYMASMNTPGNADGQIKGWIDGELIYNVQHLMIRGGPTANATWRRWWIGPWFHGGTTQRQESYIDSIVIATKYIGPKSKPSSKAAKP